MSTEEARETTERLSDAKLLGDDFDDSDSKELEAGVEAEVDPWAAMTGSKFREIMESDGPTVNAVVLKADGSFEEVRYDSTPRVQDAKRILGSNPTIIGEWADLQVLLVRGRFDDDGKSYESQPLNIHKLRFPFNEESVRGDILLYRVNDSAQACDFTLDEYNAFAAKASEDVGKVWTGPTEIDGIAEEEDEYEDDFEGEDFNGDMISAMLDQIVGRQFNEKFGRDPTEEELDSFKSVIAAKMGFGAEPVGLLGTLDELAAEDDDDDSDYVPDDADMEAAEIEDAEFDAEMSNDEDEKVDGPTAAADEENEDLNDDDDEDNFAEQYAEAIEAVRQLGRSDGAKMLARIATQFEESDETLTEALGDARERFAGAEDDDETDAVDLADDSFIDNTPLSEEEAAKVATELAEAIDVVRGVAHADALKLASKVASTFEEINGREPELAELRAIFTRIEQSFLEEANDSVVDDIAARISELPLSGEDNLELTDSEKSVILAVAKSAVTQAMANQAVEYFMTLTGRSPNNDEFNDLLISVATTRFVENFVNEEESEDDSDYDPEAATEKEQLRRDRELDDAEDAREDTASSADKENFDEEVSHLMEASEEINGPRPAVAPSKPVAFYSPVVTPGSKKKSRIASMKEAEESLDAKLFDRAVENFKNRYDRDPKEDELATLRKFIGQTDRFVHTAPIDFDIDSDSAE